MGTVVSDIRALPRALHFGALELGDFARGTVSIQSARRKPFAVESTPPTSENISIESLGAEADYHHRLVVTARVVELGNNADLVRLMIRPLGEDPFRIDVPIDYFGIPRSPAPAIESVTREEVQNGH
jgi:hypothetical protein